MNKILSYAWAGMFLLCAGLGTVRNSGGLVEVALILISILFFLPGALLLYNGITDNNRKLVLWIRWISLGSLILTTFFLILTVVLLPASPRAFSVSYYILLVVSAPLFCGKSCWYLVLFLWAFLLFSTFIKKDPPQKKRGRK